MANIARPALPSYLYRYRSIGPDKKLFEREIDAITEPYLWCGAFHTLNDPMEGFYRPSTILKGRDNYKLMVERIFDSKAQMGIASFSDTHESELMWTHYASNYSGICVEYFAQRLVDALPENVIVTRMAYGDRPPRIDAADTKKTLEGAAIKILSQKKSNWAYEREWRIFNNHLGKLEISSRGKIIRTVYLGSRISHHNRRLMIERFGGTSIKIRNTLVQGYKHSWPLASIKTTHQ